MYKQRSKLVLIVSLLLVAGFLITSLASYVVSISSLSQQLSQSELPITSDNIYSEIQRDLIRPIFISSLMSHDTFLRDWVLAGEVDETLIVKYLNEIKTKYKAVASFFVSEKTRRYYYPEGILKTVNPDEQRDEWYFRVREMKNDYEINIDPDMANRDAMTIFINYRVYDYDGNFIGATGVGLTVSAVKELIEQFRTRYGRIVYFVNPQGKIELYGADFPQSAENIYDIEGISDCADEILSHNTSSLKYRKDGSTTYVNTRYIEEFGWYLIVEQPADKVTRAIHNTLLMNLLICAIITVVVLLVTNVTISSYQKRLEELATTDKLTGIYNRQAFDILLEETLKDARRRNTGVSLIMYDLDHFKRVNDTAGHMAGDAVLRRITEISRLNLRASDVICRWGGEEFIILLKECSRDDLYKLAEKIRIAIKDSLVEFDGNIVQTSASFGITEYRHPETREQLLIRIDEALYKAKDAGRNRTVYK